MKKLALVLSLLVLFSPFSPTAFGAWGVSGTCSESAYSIVADNASLSIAAGVVGSFCSAGELAVLIVAVDNSQANDGDEIAVTTVTDSGGSTWIKAGEFTNGQGAAQAGATVSVWYAVLANNLDFGGDPPDSITAYFSNSTARDAAAMTVKGFTFAAGQPVSVEAIATRADDGIDPGSLDVTTSNQEFLRIRGIAGETGSTTALTVTTNWTAFKAAQRGSGTTGMAVRGEHRIVTATGAASNPTWVSADHASVYVVIREGTSAPLNFARRPFRGG
jgi:hypothetical protein